MDPLDGLGHGAGVRFRFNDAGARNEKQAARAHLYRADFKGADCKGLAHGKIVIGSADASLRTDAKDYFAE